VAATPRPRSDLAIVAILALGVVLHLVQYFGATSLWFDELALARAIADRSLVALVTQPLPYTQVAPVGFMAAVKIATRLFGADSLGFRLVPTIAGIAALLLCWRVAHRVLDGWAMAGALLLVAFSPALLWYGGNVKPYASDVTLTLLLVLLAIRHLERPDDRRRALAAGLIGAATPFFSFPALVTAAVLGVLLALRWLRARPRAEIVPLVTLLAPWAAGALIAGVAALALVEPTTREYMDRFWARGFPPRPWWSGAALLWVPLQLFAALGNLLLFIVAGSPTGTVYVALCAAAAVAGLVFLGRRSPWTTALVLAPAAAAALAGLAHLLPFEGRVALYAGWPLLLAAFAGLQGFHRRSRAGAIVTAILGTLIAAVPALAVLSVGRPPYRAQEARPVLRELAKRRQPGDVLVAYHGARHAVAFYGPRVGLVDWTIGECHREDPSPYFRELDRFRGQRRVWFFFTHSGIGRREPEVIRSYLATIGVLRDRIPDPYGLTGQLEAAAYLYDLSDPVRLASTTAETFRHEPITTGGFRFLCDGTRVEAGAP
jgi:Dolichyl-phosphate-mannose-protein mannosyltransferase